MEKMREETGRVIALAAGVWAGAVALAQFEGAFARFEASSIVLFAAVVSLYALAAFKVDVELRAYASRASVVAVRLVAAGLASLLAMSLVWRSAPLATFAAPLAALALAAAVETLRSRARSASPAKSPGANPAAT